MAPRPVIVLRSGVRVRHAGLAGEQDQLVIWFWRQGGERHFTCWWVPWWE
jgi:hypothetical protein